MGECDFKIGGIQSRRKAFSFVQWKVQRAHNIYTQLDDKPKADVDDWLESINGEAFKDVQIRHPIKRENYREVLA